MQIPIPSKSVGKPRGTLRTRMCPGWPALLRFKARTPTVGRVGEGGRRVAESVKAD